jgi:flagellar protein FliS
MIVIIYDILFAYMEDAKQAHEKGEREAMKEAIRKAQRVLDELEGSLNFAYPVSGNLYSLYVFCKKELARTMYENRLDGWTEAYKILSRLYTSFVEVARQDKSAPLMQNTQQVYAGMTYARGTLNESYLEMDGQRGFFV